MTLSDVQYQALAIDEIGDDASSTLATAVPLYWARWSAIADLELRFLYVKRDAIDRLLGPAKDAIDIVSDGDSVKLDQRFTHLLALRRVVETLIDQASTRSNVRPAAGELTQTAPIMAPAGAFDSNHADYRGNVYARRRRGR
jgi:hypothetical protein